MDGKLPYHVPFFISAKRKSSKKCGIITKRRSPKKSADFTKHLLRAKKGHGVINFRILNFFTPCGVKRRCDSDSGDLERIYLICPAVDNESILVVIWLTNWVPSTDQPPVPSAPQHSDSYSKSWRISSMLQHSSSHTRNTSAAGEMRSEFFRLYS